MAEQTVRYRVELDDADLAQQLESIRSRLAEGVSAYPGSLIQQTMPTFDQGQPFYAPMSYTPVSMPQQWDFPTVAAPSPPNFPTNISTGFQIASQDMSRFRENIDLGLQRAYSDSSSIYNNAVTASDMVFNKIENVGVQSSPHGVSLWDSAAGSLGLGYDSRMPMFASDYRNFYANEFGETAKNMLAGGFENVLTIAAPLALEAGVANYMGFGAAATVGGIGALAAIPVAIGMGAAANEIEAVSATSDNLFNIAMATPGRMSKSQSSMLATDLYKYSTSDEANLKEIDMQDLNSVIAQFGAGGGFNRVTDVESFKQKTSELIQNFREFMHALNMAQDEAAALMGELESRGISRASNAPNFAAQLQVQAIQAGMPTNELISYGLQMGDMLRTEGFNPAQGFDFAIDARVEMNRMLNSGNPYYKNAIYQSGGVDAATNNLLKYLTSSSGSTIHTTNDYLNNLGGDKEDRPAVVTEPKDFYKVLEDSAAVFGGDPLSALEMLSVNKQIEATIGIKQRAQRNVSLAKNFLNMVGYEDNELDPKTIVGTMIAQGNGNLDAATAWQTYGLATSFQNYDSFLDQVNQTRNLNASKQGEYSIFDVAENYFFGEKSLYGQTKRALSDGIGMPILKGAKREATRLVNSYEDMVDQALGFNRIHYEDIENMNESDLTFESVINKAVNNNRAINPTTGRVFTEDTISLAGQLGDMYHEDFKLPLDTARNREKVNNAFNFNTMNPFLRNLGIEGFTNSRVLDREDFDKYSSYVNRVMTEKDGSQQVTGIETVLDNLGFSSYLQQQGFTPIEDYKGRAESNGYTDFRTAFLADLTNKDKSYGIDLTRGATSEEYFDTLSLRKYRKSFKQLAPEEQELIYMFANDADGGGSYLEKAGVPAYIREQLMPLTGVDLSNFTGITKTIGINTAGVNKNNSDLDDRTDVYNNIGASYTRNFGLATADSAVNWLEAYRDPQSVGMNQMRDVFDINTGGIIDILKKELNSGTLQELDDLNKLFASGNIDFQKLTDLYDKAIGKYASSSAAAKYWESATPEVKAAILGRVAGSPEFIGTSVEDTYGIVNNNVVVEGNNQFRVSLQTAGEDYKLKAGSVTKGTFEDLIKRDVEDGYVLIGEDKYKYQHGRFHAGGIFGSTLFSDTYTPEQLVKMAQGKDVRVSSAYGFAESERAPYEILTKLEMGTIAGNVFTLNKDLISSAPLYNAAIEIAKGGVDALYNIDPQGTLFKTQGQLNRISTGSQEERIKAFIEMNKMNEDGISLDMATTLAAGTKAGSNERTTQVNKIVENLVNDWQATYKAQNSGASPGEAAIEEERKKFLAQTQAAIDKKAISAETIKQGMTDTNAILNRMLTKLDNKPKVKGEEIETEEKPTKK